MDRKRRQENLQLSRHFIYSKNASSLASSQVTRKRVGTWDLGVGEIWKIVRTPGKILATPLVPRMAGLCFWLVCVLLNRSILIVLHTYMLQAFFKDKNVPVPKNDRYLFLPSILP